MSPNFVLITALGALPAAPSEACNTAAPVTPSVLISRHRPNANTIFRLAISASSLVDLLWVISYHGSTALTDGLLARLALPPIVLLLSCCVPFLCRPLLR